MSISYGMGYRIHVGVHSGSSHCHCPGEVIDSRRLKHLGSVGLLVDGANLVPQSPRRGVRGTIFKVVLRPNLQPSIYTPAKVQADKYA